MAILGVALLYDIALDLGMRATLIKGEPHEQNGDRSISQSGGTRYLDDDKHSIKNVPLLGETITLKIDY